MYQSYYLISNAPICEFVKFMVFPMYIFRTPIGFRNEYTKNWVSHVNVNVNTNFLLVEVEESLSPRLVSGSRFSFMIIILAPKWKATKDQYLLLPHVYPGFFRCLCCIYINLYLNRNTNLYKTKYFIYCSFKMKDRKTIH